MGMSAFPSFMTQATPATQPLINAEPAVAAQTEQNPQVGQVMSGEQGADAPIVAQNGPSRDVKLTFAQIAPPPGSMVLRGINPNGSIEFGMRSDEVVTKAMLNFEYTPSPSLLPVQSQLKVYLNDELMGVLPVTKEQLGKKTLAQMPINPLFITDFNRVRLEFVGHYQDVCENPASTTLWLDVGRSSGLDLTYQTLNVKNDLSHFPVPFFDPRDNRTNTLPMVFAGAPDVGLQQASAIVASWFGSRSGWRGQNFPVLYNQLPDRNAIVFATNDKRPDFLRDHPAVKAPVIEMINHPQNPYVKLLVVFGRDDKDLLQAAKGIAQGNILFRGESVVVNEVKPLLPRKPYDAPNWVRTDRPVTFGELKTYEEQLQSSGLEPAAINVSLNLPPDLYLMRSTGIDMDINYRYTMPPVKDSSRMDISLNNQFLQSFNLSSKQEANRLLLRIPVLQGLLDGKTDVSIPALKLGATNQLRFDFEYMNPMPGGSVDNCITFQPVQNHVAVGWRNDVWSWDIGTTPMGFNVVDVVGGISYSDDIGPLGYTVNAHRRPISSSLLAFGGQKDSPSNTGKKWGGVRADGVGLSLSYDKGEVNGVWASLSGDQLTGKNVEDNWRVRWMTGYYYKVINQNNRRVTIGLNNMIWHYDKDLSGYSLGQGGYYSPQEYLSFAIPVMWRERTENWSWELGASGSWSHSRTKTMPRYPLMNLIPTDWQEEAARQSNDGGSSQGFGYTARALLERRVTSNWFVGTAIDIQQAKDYAPSHFLLYVRYSAAGWQGDMDLPPQPLIPYADW